MRPLRANEFANCRLSDVLITISGAQTPEVSGTALTMTADELDGPLDARERPLLD